MSQDKLHIEILEDGTIKTTTDAVSAANHQSAEEFLRMLTALTGGSARRESRPEHTHRHADGTVHDDHEHGHSH